MKRLCHLLFSDTGGIIREIVEEKSRAGEIPREECRENRAESIL